MHLMASDRQTRASTKRLRQARRQLTGDGCDGDPNPVPIPLLLRLNDEDDDEDDDGADDSDDGDDEEECTLPRKLICSDANNAPRCSSNLSDTMASTT